MRCFDLHGLGKTVICKTKKVKIRVFQLVMVVKYLLLTVHGSYNQLSLAKKDFFNVQFFFFLILS